MRPPPPQKKKIAWVGLQFLFKRLQSPREMKNKGYAIFFGGGGGTGESKVYNGGWVNGE